MSEEAMWAICVIVGGIGFLMFYGEPSLLEAIIAMIGRK